LDVDALSASAPAIGVLNAGSSSLKFALFAGTELHSSGLIDWEDGVPFAHAHDAKGDSVVPPDVQRTAPKTVADAMPAVLAWFARDGRLDAVGHRVVHGGQTFDRPLLVTPDVLAQLEAFVPLAPLHQPVSIAVIHAVAAALDVPQVVCFDTAFHRTNPPVAQAYALPQRFANDGVRRYGFHGLSYEYVASVLPEKIPEIAAGRVVVAHLGNGGSLCALANGASQASTMGFSTLDGVPMGTRPGEIDAGVLLYLLKHTGLSVAELETLLYRESGMLGLSGISADFRELEHSPLPAAAFALEVFAYRVASAVAAMACALGGLDGIVFTAGVGEHSAHIREAIVARCAWLGVTLDPAANASHALRISTRESRVVACVIPTNEELTIARHVVALLSSAGGDRNDRVIGSAAHY
jgi:acetate kinase